MSLIYQALKQSELQTTPSRSLEARKAVAAPVAGDKPGHGVRSSLGLGLAIAGVGVLAGYLLNQGFAAPGSALASQATAPPSVTTPDLNAPPAVAHRAIETIDLLPRADLPLPTAAPRLRLALALSPEVKKTTAANSTVASAPAAAAPTPEPAPVAQVATLVPPPKPAVASNTRIVEAPAVQPSTEDVRALFDALNQALENRDKPLALSKLQGIQASLPESSVARLRAESWFAHQTGDLDNASRVYRRLLEKVPGDELASVNLASIEKRRQRPDQAKEVLAKALRQNPTSSVLRSAIEQLAQSEVKQ